MIEHDDGLGRHGLAGADGPEPFHRPGLEAHGVQREAEEFSEALAHRCLMGVQFRMLQEDVDIHARDGPIRGAGHLNHAAENFGARGALPGRFRVRKVLADITESGRTEDRVGHGVKDDVAVAVGVGAERVRDDDARQDQPPPGDEAMNVEPDADTDRRCQGFPLRLRGAAPSRLPTSEGSLAAVGSVFNA